MSRVAYPSIICLWLAIAMPPPALGQGELTADQRRLSALAGTRPDITLAVRLGSTDATYRIGETLSFTVTASEEVYLTVLNIGSSGKVTVLVPNKAQPPLRAMPRQPVHIPTPGAPYTIRVSGPPGFELVKVIASKVPVDAFSGEPSRPAGPFRSLEKEAGTLVRDLPALLKRQLERGYAVADVVVRVVDSSPPAR